MSSFGGAPAPTRAHSPVRNGTTTPTPRSPPPSATRATRPATVSRASGRRRRRRGGRARVAGAGPLPPDRFIPNRTSMDSPTRRTTLYLSSPRHSEKGDDPAATRGPSRWSFGGPCGPRCCRVVGRRSPGSGGADSPRAPLLRLKIFRFGAGCRTGPTASEALRSHRGPAPGAGQRRADGGSGAAVPTALSYWTRRILHYYLNLLSWSSSNVLAASRTTSTFGTRRRTKSRNCYENRATASRR